MADQNIPETVSDTSSSLNNQNIPVPSEIITPTPTPAKPISNKRRYLFVSLFTVFTLLLAICWYINTIRTYKDTFVS